MCAQRHALGTHAGFRLEALTVEVISGLVFFMSIYLESLQGVGETAPGSDIASTRVLLGRLLAACLVMDGQMVIHDQPVGWKLLLRAFGDGNVDP